VRDQLLRPLTRLFRTAALSAHPVSGRLVANAKCYKEIIKLIICFKMIHVLTTLKKKSLEAKDLQSKVLQTKYVNLEPKSSLGSFLKTSEILLFFQFFPHLSHSCL